MALAAELIEEYYPDKGHSSDCLILTAETLEIKRSAYVYTLPLPQIELIELKHIRLLFYFLAGGFTLTLSLIAILSDFLAPLPGILLVIIGTTSLYIGWKGKLSLQITTTTNDYVFWFSGSYQPFLKFINAVRHRIIMRATFEAEQPEPF